MIQKIQIELITAEDLYFHTSPSWEMYRRVLQYIRRLSCYTLDTGCHNCPNNKSCKYAWITGNNFSGYPGILVQGSPFEDRLLSAGEARTFTFYLIGSCRQLSSFLDLFAESLEQIYQIPVRCRITEKTELSDQLIPAKSFQVQSLVESPSFESVLNPMIAWYNEHYETAFILAGGSSKTEYLSPDVRWEKVPVPGTFIKPAGNVYRSSFRNPIIISQCLIETGIGKWNCLGGGQFAVEN